MSQSDILRVQVDLEHHEQQPNTGTTASQRVHDGHQKHHGHAKHKSKAILNRNRWTRFCVFLFCLVFIILGRAAVPDNPVPGIVDKLMDAAGGANQYILQRPLLRNGMLIACSFFMDIMFFATGIFWIFFGNSSRLIVSTLIFYFVRAAVQQMFLCPYPPFYSWDDPGFPSIVVPYGRSSDFFFSGHIGFVTICMSEWLKYNKYWVAFLISLGGVYTGFILLTYQAHYSIDLFTGIIFGSWTHIIIDKCKDDIDDFFAMIYELIRGLLGTVCGVDKKQKAHQELLDKPANTEE